jgi:hypothetical protein
MDRAGVLDSGGRHGRVVGLIATGREHPSDESYGGDQAGRRTHEGEATAANVSLRLLHDPSKTKIEFRSRIRAFSRPAGESGSY